MGQDRSRTHHDHDTQVQPDAKTGRVPKFHSIEQLSKQAGNEQAAHGHRDPQNQPAQPPKQTPIIHILKSFPQRHPACGGSLDELAQEMEAAASDYLKLQDLYAEREKLEDELAHLYTEWEKLAAELEEAKS